MTTTGRTNHYIMSFVKQHLTVPVNHRVNLPFYTTPVVENGKWTRKCRASAFILASQSEPVYRGWGIFAYKLNCYRCHRKINMFLSEAVVHAGYYIYACTLEVVDLMALGWLANIPSESWNRTVPPAKCHVSLLGLALGPFACARACIPS